MLRSLALGRDMLAKTHECKPLRFATLQLLNKYSSPPELPQRSNRSDWLASIEQLLPKPSPFLEDTSVDQPGSHDGPANYASLMQCCEDAKTLLEVEITHHHILKHGFQQHRSLSSLLIRMYNSFGALEDALALFNRIDDHSLALWNSFMRAYACRGMHGEVLQMFAQMQMEGTVANKFTFIQIVSVCGRHADLAEGKRMHACIRVTVYEMDAVLGTSLISMYGKCGSLHDAHKKLHDMPMRNEVSWTAIIACYTQQGRRREALHLFDEMQKEGVKSNNVTFVCILDVFATLAALAGGQKMHACITESGFESDIKVGVALISMYNRCGSPGDAQTVFEKMMERNLILWNAMISMYVKHLEFEKALQLFNQLQEEGFIPNKTTFVCILDAYASPAALSEGKLMHVRILVGGFESDVKVGTALVNMYGRCGILENIDKVFARLLERDVVLWTSMIAIYSQHGQGEKAIRLFYQMQQDGVEPNKVTFVCILDAYSNSMELAEGKHIHAFILEKGHEVNVIVGNALISMYGRCGCLHDACDIFDQLQERTIVSWTAMISVYAQHGQFHDALLLFKQMQLNDMQPNLVTFVSILEGCALEAAIEVGRLIHMCAVDYAVESEDALVSALVNMYGKSGSLEDSKIMCNRMSEESELLWTSMIVVHAQQGQYEHSIELFHQMEKKGLKPTVVTYVCVLDACANCAVLADGERIHSSVIHSGFDCDANVVTAVLNMYGRCGNLKAAQRTFDRMPDRNVITWSAMIALYGQHGWGKDALMLFERMQHNGIMPNKVTYASVLDACNHAGLIFEAWECLAPVIQNHTPLLDVDHYACIIDLLGRTGCLDDAECLINNIPLEPTAVLFTAMLGACRYHGDVDRAEQVAKFVLELNSDNSATYVLLSNIYASSLYMRCNEQNVLH